MAFGPIMRFTVGKLNIELAPITKDAAREIVSIEHGGGIQRHSVHRYLGLASSPTEEDELEWFEKTRTDKKSLVWGIWLIEGKKRVLIGNSALTGIGDDGHAQFIRQATTGSMIFRPEYWGKGIASAAHKARTWYAFEHLGLHRLKSAVIQGNGGSRTALERSGYSFVYTERNEAYMDGVLKHLDCLECLNPLDLFWSQWWHGERPSAQAKLNRTKTLESLEWARQNVELA